MRLKNWFICGLAVASQLCNAQVTLNPKAGLSILQFADERDSNMDIRYYGHLYGVDANVLESRFLFVSGMHYHRLAIEGAQESKPFVKRANAHIISVPVKFGVQLTGERFFRLRPYAGAYFDIVVAVDDNTQELTTDRIAGFNPGWQLGVQTALAPITFDFQVIFGGRKYILVREESKLRGFILSAGIDL